MANKKTTEKITEPELKKATYFQERMDLLGITPELNKISLQKTEIGTGKAIMLDVPIFTEVEKGIKILVYTLDRMAITIEKSGSRFKEDFAQIRLEKPIIKTDGSVIKYLIPKGAGSQPFFPPSLIEKFEKKIPMKTVFLTEGYFKAFKASIHGVDIIGLSSITHMKDKETGKLHDDIVKLIKSGLVERFVWLTDGDCLDITSKEITEDKDLYVRPKGFYSSVNTFRNLMEEYDTVEKWFLHIDIDNIIASKEIKSLTRDQVKGLDDLLITFKGRESEIVSDMQNLNSGNYFFQKFNITFGTHKVWRHFHIADVHDFFLYHSDRRPELKNKEFKFIGTRYKYNEDKDVCEIKMPGEANLYFRVGDDYYKWIEKPNQHKQIERVFVCRRKATITDDHGKNFCQHVPKYEDFCNVPDHGDFKQVINNCFNVYSPLDHVPAEDECTLEDIPNIIRLITHIFGEKTIPYTDKVSKEKKEYSALELGLDYIQLLYRNPAQKLPILCLVSKENNTGKSTIGTFLRHMLSANVAIVGNADLANDFNAHWATKSVVICDEAKIDKHQVIEKIKALSTAPKVYMNAKGRGQVELDCFIKFILITNNEDNFIYASEDDIRYWIIKVPVLKHDDPDFMDKLIDEIPAFLSFLSKRKMATEKRSRMWFDPSLLKTEALKKVIQYSQPTIEKEIRSYFKEMFLDTGLDEILMSLDVVHKEVVNKKYEKNYLSNVLKDRMKVQPFHIWKVDDLSNEYLTQAEALAAAEVKHPDFKGHMIYGKLKPVQKVTRYSYPKFEETVKEGIKVRERLEVKEPPGRPLVFLRSYFVTDEENASVQIGPEEKFIKETIANREDTYRPMATSGADELPFPGNIKN